MRAARLTTIVALLLLVPVVSAAFAKGPSTPAGPSGLQGFLLRPDESVVHTFPRTPAFAWQPVRGASCYEFELATSRSFEDSTIVWSNLAEGTKEGKRCGPVKTFSTTAEAQQSGEFAESQTETGTIPAIRIPAVSLNLTLPWFTGKPYALYAHVRGITSRGPTKWSNAFGFNMRWEEQPVPMTARPGLIRWRPVDGATSYQVWYPDIRRSFSTHTNVADQRELYLFHDDPNWYSTVRWRVRAVRHVIGASPNGLPAVSYGPWSPVYSTTNPSLTSGKLALGKTVSDVVSSGWKNGAHQLMPALTFAGNQDLTGQEWPLFRVYAFTDRDCVNVVFRGSVVGGPAFAPRTSGPLELPTSTEQLDLASIGVLPTGKTESAKTFSADGFEFKSSESAAEGAGETVAVRVDLPDVDAKTTRYYWTVVPVGISVNDSGTFEYVDVDHPQDACEAGRVSTFAKLSRPAITSSGGAYVSGLTPKGRLLASAGKRPVVYSSPLVAWRPVVAATAYEIEWSRTTYPWRRAGHRITQSTSAVLNLAPGNWYYRVRGLNAMQVGVSAMTWSKPVAVKVSRPTFRVSSR
jgi:hypothetical protein